MWPSLGFLLVATALADSITFNREGLSSTLALFRNGSAIDVHAQMWAPVSAGWGAIGMGSQMENSLMFVMYPSSDGKGVTVSPRTASGHQMPEVASTIKTQVFNSSVDPSGAMMAEFTCYDCTQWASGQLSTTSESQPFVYAVGPGGQAGSDDIDALIKMHQAHGVFMGNTATAFEAEDEMSANSAPNTPPPASPANAGTPPRARYPHMKERIWAHAILMCIVFFGLMPTAVILIRLPFMGRAAYQVHWMIQMLAFSAALAAVAVAIDFSRHMQTEEFRNIENYHQIIGIALVVAIVLQGFAGFVSHMIFRKKQKRTIVSYAHIVVGWSIITLGMINGCLGLWLNDNITAAWALGVAGVAIFLGMLVVSLWAGWRRRQMVTSPTLSENQSFGRVDSSRSADAKFQQDMAFTPRQAPQGWPE